MVVNSVTALKLSAIVPRILNKKEAFICGRFLSLSSNSLFIFNEQKKKKQFLHALLAYV